MKIPLSSRLLACCSFVAPGDRVADIGCDHGYLGIYLLKNGIASAVIASDIKEGPLQSAVRNSEKFGVRDKIAFYLSDGVRNIPREFDTLICAGMGGDTMVSILSAAPWLQNARYRLILQCQSKTPMLRQYLTDTGWRIREEQVLRDGKFLYTVMEVVWQPDCPRLTPAEVYIPPAMLKKPSAEVSAYCKWVIEGLRISTVHSNDPEKKQILEELETLQIAP
ncbi:MAG: SAM-dependent methyltransferase [Oscillospiraceae bacterium]|nr:SAM-dependent methyltransferase [Oscillospiraceae bacterium]